MKELITDRFPFLIVDELQDTGWYLSEIVRDLLAMPKSSGLLVGDPDQAIYEFNGARPELFDQFKKIAASQEFPMRKSLRCPKAVVEVANQLRSGAAVVEPREGEAGTAILVATDDPASFFNQVRTALAKKEGREAVIVCRWNDGVDELEGGKRAKVPAFSSRPLSLIHTAILQIAMGNSRKALEAAVSAILVILSDQPAPDADTLAELHIELHDLRVAAARVIHAGRPIDEKETCFEWAERLKQKTLDIVDQQGWNRADGKECKVKSAPSVLKDPVAISFRRPSKIVTAGNDVAIRTVHGVKGETHDTTFFYVQRRRTCVSDDWWSTDETLAEERRVAFVAVTRSRENFVLVVPPATEKNLLAKRTAFHASFNVVSESDYLLSLK